MHLTMVNKPIMTTFHRGFADQRFSKIAGKIKVPRHLDILPKQKFNPWLELTLLLRVLYAAVSAKVLLLFSSRGYLKPELFAIVILRWLPRRMRPAIVLYGEMFEPDEGLSGWVQRLAMKLIDPGIDYYIVYSTAELTIFPQIWGVSADKMRYCPMYYSFDLSNDQPGRVEAGGYIFSGGNSYRDYPPLIEAARHLPEYKFYLATVRVNERDGLPENITVNWPSKEDYLRLIQEANAVVVPLQLGLKRTIGLLTAFETMLMGQVLIVSDAVGIRDYVHDGETGIIVDGSVDSYENAIRWVLAPENKGKVEEMKVKARKSVMEEFTLEKHVDYVISVLEEALSLKQ
jgi:glycosyltransferase involved in cell wall biosynthesis